MEKTLYDIAQFYELVLAHLLRSKEIFQLAKQLKIKPEDFLSTDDCGIQAYKIIAELAFEINNSPIEQSIVLMHLKNWLASGKVPNMLVDQIVDILIRLYITVPISEDYIKSQLKEFVRRRRETKAIMTLKDNPSELLQTLSAIKEELSGLESGSTVRIGHPFQCIIRRDQTNQMRTGLRIIDEKMGGIGFGEFIILLGFTGSGKTALATYLTLKMVTQNFTVIYITLEEPKENISNRFYSQYFSINYTDLHKGRANMILDQKFGEMEPAQRQQLIEKLHIHDMKEQTPISAEQIQLWLEKHHKETGINPDLVIIDQLEYLEPNLLNVKSQQWEQIERIAKECDKLSEYKVGREHPFGLLLLHQLNGDPKIAMKKKDIAGFKGIDRSADTLLGLGRDGLQSMDFMLACMKTRHTAPFNIKLKGELEFMRFKESTGGIIV